MVGHDLQLWNFTSRCCSRVVCFNSVRRSGHCGCTGSCVSRHVWARTGNFSVRHTLWLKHAEMVQPTIPTSDIFISFSSAEWLRIARWFKPFLATQSGFALKNAKFSHLRADIVEFVRPLCKVLFHSCTLSCCHAENLVNAYIELQDFLLLVLSGMNSTTCFT